MQSLSQIHDSNYSGYFATNYRLSSENHQVDIKGSYMSCDLTKTYMKQVEEIFLRSLLRN